MNSLQAHTSSLNAQESFLREGVGTYAELNKDQRRYQKDKEYSTSQQRKVFKAMIVTIVKKGEHDRTREHHKDNERLRKKLRKKMRTMDMLNNPQKMGEFIEYFTKFIKTKCPTYISRLRHG